MAEKIFESIILESQKKSLKESRNPMHWSLREGAGEETLVTWMPEWQAGESLYPDKNNADRVKALDADMGGVISAGLEALGIAPADAAIRDHDAAWEFTDVDQEYLGTADRAIKNAWKRGSAIGESNEYADARLSTIKGAKVVIVYNSYDDMYTVIFKDPGLAQTKIGAGKYAKNYWESDYDSDKVRRWIDPKDKDPEVALKRYYPNGLSIYDVYADRNRFQGGTRKFYGPALWGDANTYVGSYRDHELGIDFVPDIEHGEVTGLLDLFHFTEK